MSIPIYKDIYNDLQRSIRSGNYQPGDSLPTEMQLASHYNVSRTTIRKAIKLLSDNKFVTVKQGSGIVVLDYSATQKLNHVTSFTETLTRKGFCVTTRGMCITLISPPPFVADSLNLTEDAKIYYVQRVQCIDGKPISIVENYLNSDLFPGLENYTNSFTSLYQFLEEKYDLEISNATERISASCASFVESQILQIPLDSPLLISKRVSYSNGIPFEYAKLKVFADKYEYSIYLQKRY